MSTKGYRLRPDIAPIVRAAESQGWVISRGKKHLKIKSPDGQQTSAIPGAYSDHRTALNFRAEMRRKGVDV